MSTKNALENEALAWAAACAPTAKRSVALELPLAARLLVYALPHDAGEEALRAMTLDDAERLFENLTHRVGAVDPQPLADALVELMIWAAKSGRIAERKIEYLARKQRAELPTRLAGEQSNPGVQFTMAALRDGIDPQDHDAVRAHAVAGGWSPSLIESFLGPVIALGGGEHSGEL